MAQITFENRDCMEAMREFPDNFFDLAIVDPPYGDGKGGGTKRFGEMFSSCQSNGKQGTRTENYHPTMGEIWGQIRQVQTPFLDSPSLDNRGQSVSRTGGTWASKYGKKIIAWDVAPEKEYFDELFRISRNQIIWGGNYFSLPPTRCFVVWRKTNIPTEGFSMSPCEYAWTSFVRNAEMYEHSSLRDNTSGRFHPTEKPIDLYEWLLLKFAKQGDKILDTHVGSASSLIACHNRGFDVWGYEIDEDYYTKAKARLEEAQAQVRMFDDYCSYGDIQLP